MEARISFIEPSSEGAAEKVTLPIAEGAVVQNLIRAGVVTHEFKVTETFDAMFALAELNDLPEVSFVAAFKRGAIYLGCPDGPPDCIADLVVPISPVQADDQSDIATKLDALMSKTEALHIQLDRRDDAHALSKNAASRASGQQSEKLQAALLECRDGLRDLSETIADMKSNASVFQAQNNEALTELRACSEELSASMSKVDARVLQLETDAGHERQKSSEAMQEIRDLVSASDSRLPQLEEVIQGTSELKEQFIGFPLELAQNADLLKGVQDSLSALTTKVDNHAAARQDMETLAATVSEKLDGLLDAVQVDETERLTQQLTSELAPKFTKLEQAFQSLKSQPKQEVDLSEQRRSFAAFTNVMGTITKRLEAATDKADKETALSHEVAQSIERLPERLRATVSEHLELMLEGLLKDRDAPMSELHNKLDNLANTIASQAAVTNSAASSLPEMDELAVLSDQLAALPDEIEARLSRTALRSEDRDLTAQRQSLARFGTAMGHFMQRLEGAIETLAPSHGGVTAEEVTAILHALPATLHQALQHRSEAHVDPKWHANLEQLMSRTSDLADLRASIDALARRPDPVPDLSEQRRSFARFSTAMTAVVNRLESVADTVEGAGVDGAEVNALAKSFTDAKDQLRALVDVQSSQLIALQAFLSGTHSEAKEHIENNGLMSDVTDSYDHLRFLLAEQVALKLRENRGD